MKYAIFTRRTTAQDALNKIWGIDGKENDMLEPENIIIHPPKDGNCSDQESGDEEIVNSGHLSKSQLLAPAEIGDNEEEHNIMEPAVKKKLQCNWIKKKLTKALISHLKNISPI